MKTKEVPLITFLNDVMRRKSRRASPMSADIGISHATMSRWLSGKDIPSPKSCLKLAAYSSAPPAKVLALAGHLPTISKKSTPDLPDFREYARKKYPNELDEDIITMIENLIERRRDRLRMLNKEKRAKS